MSEKHVLSDMDSSASSFTECLLDWHRRENNRSMPWKGEKDPYKIWLSEIILQQTRVEQGLGYFERFVQRFPTVHDLAMARDEEVFRLWEGLGYYSRCRNLLHTARKVSYEWQGRFPASYSELLALKGVGPYTAAAIASFAFQLPHAVVDGNVQRVLARYFGLTTPTQTPAGKALFHTLAQALLDTHDPAGYNQAIMDFGATVCKPQSPRCESCFQRIDCQAYVHGWVNELPRKAPRMEKKQRTLHYLVVEWQQQWLVRERVQKDIWRHLYEYIELSGPPDEAQLKEIFPQWTHANWPDYQTQGPFQQTLTHQSLTVYFHALHFHQDPGTPEPYRWVDAQALYQLPMPKTLADYRKKNTGPT